MTKQNLLIVTNLYPLPWQPNRGSFNFQQFEHLKDNYNVFILVPVAWPDYIKNMTKARSTDPNVKYVPYFYIPKVGRRFNGSFMYQSIKRLTSSWIKKIKPDHILGSWVYPEGEVVRRLANSIGVPYSIKLHGSDLLAHMKNPVRVAMIKKVLEDASSVLTVSKHLRTKAISLLSVEHHSKVMTVYNGIDKSRFTIRESAPEEQRLVYVGYLKRTKGIMETLKSFKDLLSRNSKLKLDIVGDGEAQAEVKAYIMKNGLQSFVTMHGAVKHDEVSNFIKKATLLVLPSYSEGVPNVLLEAMSSGVPVVASNVGGIPEIIDESKNGLLCRPKDVANLSLTIEYALARHFDPIEVANSVAHFCWVKNKNEVTKAISKVA